LIPKITPRGAFGSILAPVTKRPEGLDADRRRMRMIVGLVLLAPGLAMLGIGLWLASEMFASGILSVRALLCFGLIGGGLTLSGARRLLTLDAEE
jgi:hypothetical protein